MMASAAAAPMGAGCTRPSPPLPRFSAHPMAQFVDLTLSPVCRHRLPAPVAAAPRAGDEVGGCGALSRLGSARRLCRLRRTRRC